MSAFVGGDPFPPQIRRLFKYGEILQLTTGSGSGFTGSEYRYNMNALYDPDYSSGGHQPYGFDQWSIAYATYRVDRCNYRITFAAPGDHDFIGFISIAPGTSGSIAGIDPKYLVERPNTQFGHLSAYGERKCVLTGSIELHKIFGITKQKYESEDAYASGTGVNPAALALLSIAVGSYTYATNRQCSVLVELEFDAILYSRITQAAS